MKKKSKKTYSKPQVVKIKLDKNISMIMMSPPVDPEGSFKSGIKFPFND